MGDAPSLSISVLLLTAAKQNNDATSESTLFFAFLCSASVCTTLGDLAGGRLVPPIDGSARG
jgi:hypothetical protein